ncbi:Kinesin-like protein KIN-5D [Glycine soja]|uniref:Kinesin-like protein n=1 Tax=Glycine soja TaxID=3848 RepID=A0A445IZM1_GLYSO|nr:Kinesin-like protein KIN-5D [Glycine soja]
MTPRLIAIHRTDLESGTAMEPAQRRLGGGMVSLSPSQTPRSSDKPMLDLGSADSNSNSHNKYDKDKGVNVQVLVRCRPLSEDEMRLHTSVVISCNEDKREVFGPNSQQKELYDQAVSPIVYEVLKGYNCTIFAYGQTGIGKTYTMEGGREGGVFVRGLEEEIVCTANEIYKILEKGSAKRHTAETLLNKQNSHSHSIFSITIHIKECTPEGEEIIKCGKLNLVDLAGSENISRSGAREGRAREAYAHRGLCLDNYIHCLEETLSTLDYAHRAKNIKNKPEINQKMMKSAMIKDLYSEIDRLKQDNGIPLFSGILKQVGYFFSLVNDQKLCELEKFEECTAYEEKQLLEKVAEMLASSNARKKQLVTFAFNVLSLPIMLSMSTRT